jgi:hypothetical protein
MNNRVARIALIVAGVVALLVGGIWIGQGLNLIPGSVMSGSQFWLEVGVIVAVVGVFLVAFGIRGRKKRPSDS